MMAPVLSIMSDADGDLLVMSEVDTADTEAICEKENNYVATEGEIGNATEIVTPDEAEIVTPDEVEIVTPDEGWEVVNRRKNYRKDFLKNNKNSDEKLNNKTELSILDKLSLHLRDEKVRPVDHEKANKSLHYLRNQWQHWTFGRVIRIQGMYAFFSVAIRIEISSVYIWS